MNPELTIEKKPWLSVCVICGDEGVATLARMLRSVLDRDGGPLCDEVVISWNGSDDVGFEAALRDVLRIPESDRLLPVNEGEVSDLASYGACSIKIHKQVWYQDFARARNENFAVASGTFRMYLDCDDIVSRMNVPEERAAIDASLVRAGVDLAELERRSPAGPTRTLMQWLRGRDATCNCIELPYDYVIGGDGQTLEGHPRRRLWRWADGWVWDPATYYHEDVVPVGGCVPDVRSNAGLPIRHFPSRSVEERTARNRAILDKMRREVEAGARSADATLFYNLATYALQEGDQARAVGLLSRALEMSQDVRLSLIYRRQRARCYVTLGQFNMAGADAVDLVWLDSPHRTGWDLLVEIAHAQGRWSAVVDFFNCAVQRPVNPGLDDHPVEREAHLRVYVAVALQGLGQLDAAVAKAREALAAAPDDAMARECFKRVERAQKTAGRAATALALARSYIEDGDYERAECAVNAVPAEAEFDPAVLGLRTFLDTDSLPAVFSPLPIFRAPSPWARWLGAWALRRGETRVCLLGRPHPDDVAALRRIVPEIEWLEALAHPGALRVAVDTVHIGHLRDCDVEVFPTPEVADPLRRSAPTARELYENDYETYCNALTDLVHVENPRPDSDVPRVIAVYNADRNRRARIAIYAPHWAEVWTPDAVTQEGCGGSEEAIVYLSAQLAALGHPVAVYGPWKPPGGVEVRDGVAWLHASEFGLHTHGDVLILHRAPWALRNSQLARNFERLYVWHHDHAYLDDGSWTPENASRARHLWVSDWQRKALADLLITGDPLQGVVIGNGVPPEEFQATNIPRNEKRVVFASQPQRGLEPLLDAWPLVLLEEPEAELHIFYGWNTVEFLAAHGQPELQGFIERCSNKIRGASRVVARGRVSQAQLAREMLAAGVWCYPCLYPETSCLAGLRAAAAGLKLVFTQVAALPETMPDSSFSVAEDASTADVASAIVRAIRDSTYPREHVARETLARCSWAQVARKLSNDIRDL